MRQLRKQLLAVILLCAGTIPAYSQNPPGTISLRLTDLNAFREPGSNWIIGSDALANINKEGTLNAIPGYGVAINNITATGKSHLITKAEMGDMELELDFMMSKGSNSGVYLQGRYEIQLFDSWIKLNPGFSDCGGIYQRWDEKRGETHEDYEGIAPLCNVSKAPGLWQHLLIRFQAPVFSNDGKKIRNARFTEVYLNGVLVQLQADVTGPTRAAVYTEEKPTGPLMLQGDHGNIAFRNIRYKPLEPATTMKAGDNPILINTEGKPYLLRSFLLFGTKKLTHVISAGYPNQLNFSYDLKQGALLQIWRGPFMDVTDMWYERGEPQLAKPLGSVIQLSDAPTVAVLSDTMAAWPDSAAFDDLINKGYTLDESRFPGFDYEYKGIKISDKISASDAKALVREIKVSNPPANLYARLVSGSSIENLGMGLYAIDNKSYYIQLSGNNTPLIRETGKGKELLLPIGAKTLSIRYSISW